MRLLIGPRAIPEHKNRATLEEFQAPIRYRAPRRVRRPPPTFKTGVLHRDHGRGSLAHFEAQGLPGLRQPIQGSKGGHGARRV
jgi:hypothetical protein